MNQKQNFTEGPIYGPLIRFTLPILLALFLQTMYGAVDLMIVGRFGGELSGVYVSGVSTGGQVMQTITFFISALAMGLTVFVGRMIGAGRRDEAGRIVGSGIWLFAVIAVVFAVSMVLAARPMARVMKAPPEAFEATVQYIQICSAGLVFVVAYNLIGSIFRGIGDSIVPLVTVAIACVLNILGDLLLVAVFHMGAAGAAIATVFAQAVSVVLSLMIIRRRQLPFDFDRKSIRPNGAHTKEILRVGIPIALQDLLVSVSFLVITAILNDLGLIVSAGVGVAGRLCGFLMLVTSAFTQSLSAFVAQNIGAGKPQRARRTLLYGILTSLGVGIVMCYFTVFHGDLLAGLFSTDAEVVAAAAEYLKAYGIDCIITAFMFCFIGYFNGCSRATFVMAQGIVGAFCVRLPLSWLLSRHEPLSLFRIGLATPASSLTQTLMCVICFIVLLRREKRAQETAAKIEQ